MRLDRGQTLIPALIGLSALVIALWLLSVQRVSSRQHSKQMEDKVVAQLFANELLELFRSANFGDVLLGWMKLAPSSSSLKVPLCTSINRLDRVSGAISNRDAMVELPPSQLDHPPGGVLAPNRSYQVNVMTMTATAASAPLTLNKSYCNGSATTKLQPNERYSVTVAVSWVPEDKTIVDVQRVTLSTIVPGT